MCEFYRTLNARSKLRLALPLIACPTNFCFHLQLPHQVYIKFNLIRYSCHYSYRSRLVLITLLRRHFHSVAVWLKKCLKCILKHIFLSSFLSSQTDCMSGQTLSLVMQMTGLWKKIICMLTNEHVTQVEISTFEEGNIWLFVYWFRKCMLIFWVILLFMQHKIMM